MSTRYKLRYIWDWIKCYSHLYNWSLRLYVVSLREDDGVDIQREYYISKRARDNRAMFFNSEEFAGRAPLKWKVVSENEVLWLFYPKRQLKKDTEVN